MILLLCVIKTHLKVSFCFIGVGVPKEYIKLIPQEIEVEFFKMVLLPLAFYMKAPVWL